MSPLPSRSPPFPYTTLFRSHHSAVGNVIGTDAAGVSDVERARVIDLRLRRQDFGVGAAFDRPPRRARVIAAEQVLRSGVGGADEDRPRRGATRSALRIEHDEAQPAVRRL